MTPDGYLFGLAVGLVAFLCGWDLGRTRNAWASRDYADSNLRWARHSNDLADAVVRERELHYHALSAWKSWHIVLDARGDEKLQGMLAASREAAALHERAMDDPTIKLADRSIKPLPADPNSVVR